MEISADESLKRRVERAANVEYVQALSFVFRCREDCCGWTGPTFSTLSYHLPTQFCVYLADDGHFRCCRYFCIYVKSFGGSSMWTLF